MLICARRSISLFGMAKTTSKAKPRLVVYLTSQELQAAKTLAKISGLTTPHQWLGVLMRKAFAQSTR